MTETLDLNKLLFGHSILSLLGCISVNPIYNLPISLFGLFSSNFISTSSNPLKQFTFLLFLSLILDIIWLAAWSNQSSNFTEALVIANLLLKPVTILACLSNLRQQGTSFSFPSTLSNTFPGLTSNNNQPWQQSQSQSQPYQNFNDDEESAITKPNLNPQKKSQPNIPSDNYHTLGDE